ncbi:U1 small nuclear ribonucleoprotein C-like [Tubulanus polymorphus]|uniref:U1 small nuclear ribonucleoprotein C-like n=1 Tax=Tubulanus polymorphus TaxID=672921 RepID=UPI003DA1DEEF
MPKYFCDYCDTYLTHDSPSVRKTHCNGRKHKENVRIYYTKWLEEQVQKLVDDTTAAYKSGKINTNPFNSGGPGNGPAQGAMIPPPPNLGGAMPPKASAAPMPPMGGPMPPHMPPMMMGPHGPMPPMMPGMRGPMGPMMGPPMMGPPGIRTPMMAPPPQQPPKK